MRRSPPSQRSPSIKLEGDRFIISQSGETADSLAALPDKIQRVPGDKGRIQGLDVDKPRNLAKSVTVE